MSLDEGGTLDMAYACKMPWGGGDGDGEQSGISYRRGQAWTGVDTEQSRIAYKREGEVHDFWDTTMPGRPQDAYNRCDIWQIFPYI